MSSFLCDPCTFTFADNTWRRDTREITVSSMWADWKHSFDYTVIFCGVNLVHKQILATDKRKDADGKEVAVYLTHYNGWNKQ